MLDPFQYWLYLNELLAEKSRVTDDWAICDQRRKRRRWRLSKIGEAWLQWRAKFQWVRRLFTLALIVVATTSMLVVAEVKVAALWLADFHIHLRLQSYPQSESAQAAYAIQLLQLIRHVNQCKICMRMSRLHPASWHSLRWHCLWKHGILRSRGTIAH